MLCVESLGWAGGEFGVDQAVDGMRVLYSLEFHGNLELLDDVQWADWRRNNNDSIQDEHRDDGLRRGRDRSIAH